MKELIDRSYQAIRIRGLIDVNTDMEDFIIKMNEECNEIMKAYFEQDMDHCLEEVSDLMTVCIMALHHHGFDPIKEFEKTVIKNENRANAIQQKEP